MNYQPTDSDLLRTWASGVLPQESGVEMLIRAGFAGRQRPWVKTDRSGAMWVDFDAIEPNIGTMSGGERRYLMIAASLGSSDVQVNLSDVMCGMDARYQRLVFAALVHAGGRERAARLWPDE